MCIRRLVSYDNCPCSIYLIKRCPVSKRNGFDCQHPFPPAPHPTYSPHPPSSTRKSPTSRSLPLSNLPSPTFSMSSDLTQSIKSTTSLTSSLAESDDEEEEKEIPKIRGKCGFHRDEAMEEEAWWQESADGSVINVMGLGARIKKGKEWDLRNQEKSARLKKEDKKRKWSDIRGLHSVWEDLLEK